MPLESTTCPVCQGSAFGEALETHDRLCGVPGTFALVRCRACGLTYLNPRPDVQGIAAYYPAAYDPHQIQRIEALPPLKRFTARYGLRKRCRVIAGYKRGGKVLDVGCATGLFLVEMRKNNRWEAFGVEPGAEAAATAAEVHGLRIHIGELASAHYADASFDAVTLWDVLEHLHDPLAVLREVHRVLKPDGILVMRTPSLDSWDARLFGPYWAGLDSPRHLVVFTKHTLTQLMQKAGFSIEQIGTGTGSYVIFLLSLRFWLADRIRNPRRRAAVLRLFDNPISKALALLPFAITDRLGFGAAIMVVGRPVMSSRPELTQIHD